MATAAVRRLVVLAFGAVAFVALLLLQQSAATAQTPSTLPSAGGGTVPPTVPTTVAALPTTTTTTIAPTTVGPVVEPNQVTIVESGERRRPGRDRIEDRPERPPVQDPTADVIEIYESIADMVFNPTPTDPTSGTSRPPTDLTTGTSRPPTDLTTGTARPPVGLCEVTTTPTTTRPSVPAIHPTPTTVPRPIATAEVGVGGAAAGVTVVSTDAPDRTAACLPTSDDDGGPVVLPVVDDPVTPKVEPPVPVVLPVVVPPVVPPVVDPPIVPDPPVLDPPVTFVTVVLPVLPVTAPPIAPPVVLPPVEVILTAPPPTPPQPPPAVPPPQAAPAPVPALRPLVVVGIGPARPSALPGGLAAASGTDCPATAPVTLRIEGREVGRTIANGAGVFNAELNLPPDLQTGRRLVSASCGPVTLEGRLQLVQTLSTSSPAAGVTTLAALLSFFVLVVLLLRATGNDRKPAS